MKKSTSIVTAIGGVVLGVGLILTWLLAPSSKSVPLEVQLGHGWICEIGHKSEIDPLLPKQILKGLGPDQTLYGFTIPANKIVYIISHNPETVVSHWHQITLVFDKALDLPTPDVRTLPEYKALDEESQDVSGVIFHEVIGHGSDAVDRGHLRASLSYFWPEFPAPATQESVRNPWRLIVQAWPETYTYDGKLMWKSVGQHEAWVYITDDQYLQTIPPSTNAKDPHTYYTHDELVKLNE